MDASCWGVSQYAPTKVCQELLTVKEDLESRNSDSTTSKLEWTVHPVKRNWKVSAGVILFLIILCAFIYYSFDSFVYLFLSVIFLAGSLSQFFFPTKYILREDCITVKSPFRKFSRQWNHFGSYYPDKNGVLLSPFPSPSRLENFRGVYIRFSYNRAEVMDFIKEKIKM